jgi:photosystem II stability/assembly factor-like uncharacterized protein
MAASTARTTPARAGSTSAPIAGLPSDFGFPLAIDPHDPDRAYVIPLKADADRVTPEGRVRVYETRDRGATWQARDAGLPQSQAYLTVLRQAFCSDGGKPLGLYFGATSGEVFGSADGGRTGPRDRDPPTARSRRCVAREARHDRAKTFWPSIRAPRR